jgi:hypothetical protein
MWKVGERVDTHSMHMEYHMDFPSPEDVQAATKKAQDKGRIPRMEELIEEGFVREEDGVHPNVTDVDVALDTDEDGHIEDVLSLAVEKRGIYWKHYIKDDDGNICEK